MELRQLRYFVAIVDSGSLTKAAERVFVAQSALSHQLAQLEAELGVRLLDRSRRGVEPTEAGLRFLPHAVAMLRQAEDAVASARSTGAEPEGQVVLGLPHSASHALALPLLREVRQQLPRVTLELTEELTGNLMRQLRSGQVQLAVLFDDGSFSGFTAQRVLREALCLIEPALSATGPAAAKRAAPEPAETEPVSSRRPARHTTGHAAPLRPRARQPAGASAPPSPLSPTSSPTLSRPLSLKQALARPLILPAHPHGVRPLIEAAATRAGLPAPRVEADISSISILRTTLLAGMGRTLLPVMPLQADIQAGLLRATPVRQLSRVLAVCSSAHIPRSPACQAVARLVVQLMQRLAVSGDWEGAQVI